VRNRLTDEKSQIMVYQRQIHELRSQLRQVLASQRRNERARVPAAEVDCMPARRSAMLCSALCCLRCAARGTAPTKQVWPPCALLERWQAERMLTAQRSRAA
jgi:hypothetical protein